MKMTLKFSNKEFPIVKCGKDDWLGWDAQKQYYIGRELKKHIRYLKHIKADYTIIEITQ